jgi:hypothetical protein
VYEQTRQIHAQSKLTWRAQCMSRLKSLSHCATPGHQPAFPHHAQMRHRPTGLPQHIQETGQVTQTTHMMPHHHWFASCSRCNVPICLANSKLVYVVGVGLVWFQPVVEGQQPGVVEFTRVLHDLELCSNLLSVLYLTQHKAI